MPLNQVTEASLVYGMAWCHWLFPFLEFCPILAVLWIRANIGPILASYLVLTRWCGGITIKWWRLALWPMAQSHSEATRDLTFLEFVSIWRVLWLGADIWPILPSYLVCLHGFGQCCEYPHKISEDYVFGEPSRCVIRDNLERFAICLA